MEYKKCVIVEPIHTRLKKYEDKAKKQIEDFIRYFNSLLKENQWILIEYDRVHDTGFIKNSENLTDTEVENYNKEIFSRLRSYAFPISFL